MGLEIYRSSASFLIFSNKKESSAFCKASLCEFKFYYSVLFLGFFSVIPSFGRVKNTVAKVEVRECSGVLNYIEFFLCLSYCITEATL